MFEVAESSDSPADPAGAGAGSAPAEPESVAAAVRDPARLAALRGTGLLDTGPEDSFDRLTRLASELLDAPVSLISLVDEDRQYFKSAVGLTEPWASRRETPLSYSICQHVVSADGPLAMDNTHDEKALRDNRAATELGAGSYAGAPLRASTGEAYGALCVIDTKPRRWSRQQMAIVEQLAEAASGEIELRGRLAHALQHDPVTGLANRDQFVILTERALRTTTDRMVTILAIGIANLDLVKASLGRDVEKKLLIAIAARLKDGVREAAVVGRLEDDQFALLGDVSSERQALAWADRIRELLLEPVEVEGESLHPLPSIGIALADTTDTAEGLVEGASAAAREARELPDQVRALGGNSLRADALERMRVENALRMAIQCETLRVFYQPKLRLADRSIVGFEALLRWEDPELGTIPPSTFIPIAEASGLIGALGRFVLLEACAQAAAWRGAFPALDLSMAVNVSARQMNATDLAMIVSEALEKTGLPADRLTLEITESALLSHPTEQLRMLSKVSRRGVRLDLDDFGTGYSSLSYLEQLPLNGVKIDRSFVDGLASERTQSIVEAIIAVARALRLEVIAEGIETEAQLERIEALGCRFGQGYLFARPQPAESLEDFLARGTD